MKKKRICGWCKTREATEKAVLVTRVFKLKKGFPSGKTSTKFREISVCSECAKHKLSGTRKGIQKKIVLKKEASHEIN